MTKTKKDDEIEQQIGELTLDLQRTRADFENFRKRVEAEKHAAQALGETKAIMKLLPVIDTIERAIVHMPNELKDNQWAQGVTGLVKQLEKALEGLNLQRIEAAPGTVFNPEFHQAIQFDDTAEGEEEVIAEELQPGYTLNGAVARPALVKVTRK